MSKTAMPRLVVGALLLSLVGGVHASHDHILDDFEKLSGWNAGASPGAYVEIAQDAGATGMGMRIDFDFRNGPGYVFVHKAFSMPLPKDYAFSFSVKADAPANNFEFKVLDPSDQNVWWLNQHDFTFPKEWGKITVKRRHLSHAWGPAGDTALNQAGGLEFAIATGTGGKGSVWIDDLAFEKRQGSAPYKFTPTVTASTSTDGHGPALVLDQVPGTSWKSGSLAESQWVLLDFLKNREFGGLVIDWDRDDYATAYEVQTSADGVQWKTAYTVTAGNGGRDYIYTPEAESRYLRLELRQSSRGQGYVILAVDVRPYEFSSSIHQFFSAIARDAPRGLYPKYCYGEQSYWTVVGTDGDHKKALLNEEGMLEVDKGAFSVEPFLYVDGKLISWNAADPIQELEQGYLPIPSVTWHYGQLVLKITAFATGEPGASSLYAKYRVQNTGTKPQRLSLFLAVRPFQVNPPWQSLNMVGGVSAIHEIAYEERTVRVNQEKRIVPLTSPDRFGAVTFDQGSVTDYLAEGKIPAETRVSDPFGFASGAMEYGIELPPGGAQDVYLAIPFHEPKPAEGVNPPTPDHAPQLPPVPDEALAFAERQLDVARRDWEAKLNRVEIQLPPGIDTIASTMKSTLAYVLINRDGPALQPGSRSYSRSWIRDGAMTSVALLEMGHTEEVRDFIRWYARYQFADGKIPCCVDRRGADSVPENDSDGEFIYLVTEYYRFTRDVGFLQEMWPQVVKAVEHVDSLRRQRTTDAYKTEEKLPFYGLVPESISHEGYSANPVHSYWDDFWVLRGLKDAASMAVVLGDEEHAASFAALRDGFRGDLYASISRTRSVKKIDYIPASVELGDFDATSTAVAIAPGGELQHLPEPALTRTFDDYYAHFLKRRSGELEWDAYTPYELRSVGALVQMGQRQRALETLRFFLADRRPLAWNHWAEVVWHDPENPRFIGDMPHTWVGSEYLRAVRTLFAFERESDRSLVIGAGLPPEWVDSPSGTQVKRFPTYYGTLNYRLHTDSPGQLVLSLSGDISMPPGKIIVKPPIERPLKGMTVNGTAADTFDAFSATIGEFPAEVVLQY